MTYLRCIMALLFICTLFFFVNLIEFIAGNRSWYVMLISIFVVTFGTYHYSLFYYYIKITHGKFLQFISSPFLFLFTYKQCYVKINVEDAKADLFRKEYRAKFGITESVVWEGKHHIFFRRQKDRVRFVLSEKY